MTRKPIIPAILAHEQRSECADDIFDTSEAAEYLKMSASSLNKMRVYGTGPAFCRAGRLVRYRRGDLNDWIIARRTNSTSEADMRLPKKLSDTFAATADLPARSQP